MPIISGLTFTETASTIVATWTTDVGSDSNLSVGGKAAIDNGFQTSVTSHQAIVVGLLPGTAYSCFVTSGGTSSAPQVVTTSALDVRTSIKNVSNGASTTTLNHGDDVCSFVSSDNKTYVTEDDGYGFVQGTPNAGANMQLDVLTTEATLVGTTVNLLTNYGGFATSNGTDGPGGAALSNKQTGLFGMLGNLYMFQNRSYAPGTGHPLYQEFYGNIMMSADKGATWNSWQATGVFNANGVPPSPLGSFQFANGNIGTLVPLRYAVDDGTMGYTTAGNQIDGANGYVYVYYQTGVLQDGNALYLLRMPRCQFSVQSTTGLQYWAGPAYPSVQDFVTDANWSSSAAAAVSIYSAANQVSNPDVIFIPAMNRYLMLNWYYPLVGSAAAITTQSVWQVLEAPTPAGPWTIVGTQTNSLSGWYMPKVQHRAAASNVLTAAVPLQIIYSGDYNAGVNTYYYPTYSTLTLNPASGAMMIQLVTDNFTRANENPLANGNWGTITGYGNLKVLSNVAQAASILTNSNQFWSGAGGVSADGNWAKDQYAEVTVGTYVNSGTESFGPGVRLGSGGTGYIVSTSVVGGTNTQNLYKLTGSGGYTSLGNWSTAPVVGSVVRLTAVGTTLTVTLDGVQELQITDATYASGAPGFYMYDGVAGDTTVSLFAAGANQAAPPTFSPVAGTYTSTQSVTISCATAGATIYYTTDGSTPTHSSASFASGGTITVSVTETVKAIASVALNADSVVAQAAYTINGYYSVPDCRNYATFPNTAVNVNGTETYTGQTSSNSAIPPTDSRKAGTPTASGTYPQNSRTPGTYGPGE